MITRTMESMLMRIALVGACVLQLAGCTGNIALGPDAVKGKTVDGTVDMQEVQAAYIGSGTAGQGTLFFRGREYQFNVGALGGGGVGVSTVAATGEGCNRGRLCTRRGN